MSGIHSNSLTALNSCKFTELGFGVIVHTSPSRESHVSHLMHVMNHPPQLVLSTASLFPLPAAKTGALGFIC